MSKVQGVYPIIDNVKLTNTAFKLSILSKEIANIAKAGQFVHVKCEGFFLRRPISIFNVDKDKDMLEIVFEVRGEGTEYLSKLKKGDKVDVMGSLGNGFTLKDKNTKALLVGGGIGTPPMYELAKHYKENALVVLGFRNKEAIILKEEFEKTGAEVIICTDDGSYGHKGFVTDIVKERVSEVAVAYACGPHPMLKAVKALTANIETELSLEERMGCGVGACLVCVCETKKNGEVHNSCICKEGPVFKAEEVLF